ncbi:MAG TPA: L,D-transpeptidase [Planctomycetota bacterium]|nr:L,D-transpeptidase [Planctomycetota bacterium]
MGSVRRIVSVLLIALPILAAALAPPADPAVERAERRAHAFRRLHGAGAASIEVRKRERRLSVRLDGRVVWSTRVGLGTAPEGRKRAEGDRRTPEGDYFVCTRNAQSRFHLFLGLSYPNTQDAEAGVREGRIGPHDRVRIDHALSSGTAPPWDTPLGGEVGLHGHGASRDWTHGCVALEDEDVELLWGLCPLGTPVRILP